MWLHVAARPDQKTPERELRGNDSANKLFEKFGPLKGSRALGKLAPEKLKEVGLDAPKKKTRQGGNTITSQIMAVPTKPARQPQILVK